MGASEQGVAAEHEGARLSVLVGGRWSALKWSDGGIGSRACSKGARGQAGYRAARMARRNGRGRA